VSLLERLSNSHGGSKKITSPNSQRRKGKGEVYENKQEENSPMISGIWGKETDKHKTLDVKK